MINKYPVLGLILSLFVVSCDTNCKARACSGTEQFRMIVSSDSLTVPDSNFVTHISQDTIRIELQEYFPEYSAYVTAVGSFCGCRPDEKVIEIDSPIMCGADTIPAGENLLAVRTNACMRLGPDWVEIVNRKYLESGVRVISYRLTFRSPDRIVQDSMRIEI